MATVKPKERQPTLRFEATLGPAPRRKALSAAADLDLDRLPDVQGRVHLLITAEDAERLLREGFEVHLKRAVPVKPLDAGLVMPEARAKAWLEERVKGLPRQGGR